MFLILQVLFTALFGFFLFGQIPDWMSVVGYAVICGVSVVIFLYNRTVESRGQARGPV